MEVQSEIKDGFLIIKIPLKIGDHQLDIKLARALQKLTVTECKIFRDIMEGTHYKGIADKHNCSVSTVKHHLGNIYRKLNVATRYELQRSFR